MSQVITANHQIKQVKNNEFILRSTHKATKKNVLVLLLKPFFNNILFLCENLSNLRREERKKNVSHNFFSNEKQKNIKKEKLPLCIFTHPLNKQKENGLQVLMSSLWFMEIKSLEKRKELLFNKFYDYERSKKVFPCCIKPSGNI